MRLFSFHSLKVIIPLTALSFFYSGCGNTGNPNKKNPAYIDKLSKEIVKSMERGEIQYRKHCIACHQANGSGYPGMYPPLQETRFVLGDKEQLIEILLNGLSGPIKVKGENYNSVMAPYSFLNNQQIADLLTYVRNSFGNKSNPVFPEDVARLRNQIP